MASIEEFHYIFKRYFEASRFTDTLLNLRTFYIYSSLITDFANILPLIRMLVYSIEELFLAARKLREEHTNQRYDRNKCFYNI